ncbi:NAD(P)H-dependent oxidoreductase [Chitinimonas lacunae]|uniref:NAD(P)H-dependent oxidoreductase n=1 Tax=Chitinimonas lacunae TaxID=1963018 RepID=A0ABV8MKU8_9NEIS
MGKRILLIQGHPDPQPNHLGHALDEAYAEGAQSAGHEIRRINVAQLDFPLLRNLDEWKNSPLPPTLQESQAAIEWCEHLVLFFPLWLGDMPALLKGFLEQVARPGFAFDRSSKNPLTRQALNGRSARVVVTMGMPASLYRWYFRAHSLRSLERNILGMVGIAPVDETLIGMVDELSPEATQRLMKKLRKLGQNGD